MDRLRRGQLAQQSSQQQQQQQQQPQDAGVAGTGRKLNDEELDRILLHHLLRRGYRNVEELVKRLPQAQSLEELAATNSLDSQAAISTLIQYYSTSDASLPVNYFQNYELLVQWVHQSLDLYKSELKIVLFPLFVHCFLDLLVKGFASEAKDFFDRFKRDHQDSHPSHMEKLEKITAPEQVVETEVGTLFRRNRFQVRMSVYSFELLISFLHENRLLILIGLLNHYISVSVFMGTPLQTVDAEAASGIVDDPANRLPPPGSDAEGLVSAAGFATASSGINEKQVLWGPLPEAKEVALVLDDDEYRSKKKTGHVSAFAHQHQQQTSAHAPGPTPNSVLSVAAQVYTPPVPSSEDGRPLRPARDRIPLPKPKDNDIEVRVRALKETRSRVHLGGTSALPSTVMYTMLNAAREVSCTSFSEDTELLAAGFADSHVQVWNLTGEKFLPLKNGVALYNTDVRDNDSLSMSDIVDKSPAAYARASETHKFIGHSGPVYSVDWSFDNRFLLSGSQDSTLRLWSMETLSNLVCYRGHLGPVWSVAFSPVGFYFASASHDRTARLWSTDEIYPLRVFAGHESDVDVVKFHPNCNYIATGSSDRYCRLWDIQTGECVRIFGGHHGPVHALAISPDGRYLASGGLDKMVILWDIASGKRIKSLQGHQGPVYSLDFSVEGSVLASGSADNSVRIWDVKKSVSESSTPSSVVAAAAAASSSSSSNSKGGKTAKTNQNASPELLTTYHTKATSVHNVRFSRRNLLFTSGTFQP